jgi:hypothetical protein
MAQLQIQEDDAVPSALKLYDFATLISLENSLKAVYLNIFTPL